VSKKKITVRLTAHFERSLEAIKSFLAEADALQAYDRLLDELVDTLIPNLERFPAMGRNFLERPAGSVEAVNALERLQARLQGGELREYLLADYLVLYARFDTEIYLLAIKHHRQLSFDFQSWYSGGV
jgi:plasmid stabilization system protein ParE